MSRLATQAYRRPLEEGDLDGLMSFYDQAEVEGGFEGGVRMALQAVLASPHFLFRMEEAPGAAPGDIYEISDVDLASRLSFFLWGAPPDQALVDLASRGDLSSGDELERQARRMLDDSRAPDALANRFAAQWLRLQDLDKIHPDALSYPYYDETLAASMHQETELLFAHIVEEDRPVIDLLTADYTFVDERLARHYGIPGITGPRVPEGDLRRRESAGHPRTWQHPHDDVARQPERRRSSVVSGCSKCCSVRRRHLRRRTSRRSKRPRARTTAASSLCASAWSCTGRTPCAWLATRSSTPSVWRSRTST